MKPEDEPTGLPGLRTWGRVYLLVAASFVLWVGVMVLIQEVFS